MLNASPKGPAPCHCCAHLFRLIFKEVSGLKEHTESILRFILHKEQEETIYRDAAYTCDRVGISESTLLRCQRKKQIVVAKLAHGKKYFRDQDVERLRREYWGRE